MFVALITGVDGFVGRWLAKHLEDEGFEVHGFDLKAGNDIRDYEQIRTCIEYVLPDYIFHLAAQAYVPETTSDVRRGFDVNVAGTLNLLEAVRHTGCKARVHLAGTSEEYGYHPVPEVLDESVVPRPTTPYGVSKLAAGHLGLVYSQTYGIPVVVTRAFNHTGPSHPPVYAVPSFAKRVAAAKRGPDKKVVHGNLEAQRNYTDVRDMVRAYRLAIDLPSDVYNVCSDSTVSMEWVLHELIELSDDPWIEPELDESLYRGGPSWFPEASSTKFRNLTGWEPEITLEETLADTLAYWEGQI